MEQRLFGWTVVGGDGLDQVDAEDVTPERNVGLVAIGDSRGIGALVIKTLVFPEWWLFVPLPAAALLIGAEFVRRIGRALAAPKA